MLQKDFFLIITVHWGKIYEIAALPFSHRMHETVVVFDGSRVFSWKIFRLYPLLSNVDTVTQLGPKIDNGVSLSFD